MRYRTYFDDVACGRKSGRWTCIIILVFFGEAVLHWFGPIL